MIQDRKKKKGKKNDILDCIGVNRPVVINKKDSILNKPKKTVI